MVEDRRRFLRFHVPLNIEYRVPGASHAVRSQSANLSRGGVKIVVSGEVVTSENLDLKITIPQDEEPIFANTKVVWMKERDAGLEFNRITNADKSRLLDYAYERWLNTQEVAA